MKRTFLIALSVAVAACCFFLLLRRVEHRKPDSNAQFNPAVKDTNADEVSREGPAMALTNRPTELIRPPSLDDEQWRGLQLIWRRLKEENQLIEFYLRVIDQDGQPVSGAVFTTELTRTDEEKLKPENFLRLRPGEEVVTERLKLTSDGQGWIRYRGTGRYIFLGGGNLSKEGYLWNLPPTLGTLIYEPGKRRATVSVEMHYAFDPKKGYVLHLWKKRETEAIRPVALGINMDQEIGGRWVSNYFIGLCT